MDLIYQAVSNLDVLWLISAALVILILDVFILGTTALLLVSGTLFVLSVIKYFIDNPVIVTWSIPTVLVALFLMQRFFINISVSQKLPNQERRQVPQAEPRRHDSSNHRATKAKELGNRGNNLGRN